MINVSVKFDWKQFSFWFQALLLLSGISFVSYGLYVAWRPLGFIFAGVALFGIGLLMNKAMEKQSS